MNWTARAGRTALTAGLLTLCFAAVGLGFNALRAAGLPLVAVFPYQQDCPEKIDKSPTISAAQARRLIDDPRVLLIDARPRADFEREHLPRAKSLPFSFVSPVTAEQVAPLKKHRLVIVYGDSPADRLAAAMAAQLRQAGLSRVKVLIGGLAGFSRSERAGERR